MFHATGEVLDSGHRAVVLPLRSVQLHSGPQAAGELSAAAEPQGPHLSTNTHRRKTRKTITTIANGKPNLQLKSRDEQVGSNLAGNEEVAEKGN